MKAEAMLQRLEQKVHEASERAEQKAAFVATAHKISGASVNQKLHTQPAQNAQRTWANVAQTST
jgi:CRISPR/Cas system endoribonuclease Cas6 (RAMP superfamily)